MQITTIKNIDEVKKMKEEWNNLLVCSISNTPFLRNEYQTTWWEHQGGGEWEEAELNLVIVREDDGQLFGIAPFYFTQNEEQKNVLRLVGGIEISDYLDVIVKEENAEEFWGIIFDELIKIVEKWDAIEIYNLQEDSETVDLLEKNASIKGFSHSSKIYQPTPQITLPESWDDYLEMLEKKFKKNLTRRMRMAENHYIPVRWEFVSSESFENELETFFDMMSQDPEKSVFLTESMKSQMMAIIHVAKEENMLQFVCLKMDEETLAGLLFFDYDNKLWGYNSALNLSQLSLSPGLVLKGYHIRWAIENGYQIYDFMRGNEGYKYDFGAKNKHVLKVEISRG